MKLQQSSLYLTLLKSTRKKQNWDFLDSYCCLITQKINRRTTLLKSKKTNVAKALEEIKYTIELETLQAELIKLQN